MAQLPTSPEAKPEHLRAAAQHGDAIRELSSVGKPAGPLRAYTAAASDLQAVESDGRLLIRFGDHVTWEFSLDAGGNILGYGFTGYGDLMQALGIDFAGQPYAGGNGG